jgi:hypothetical protein
MVTEHRRARPRWWKGARVRVRNRFDRSWASGFEIADHDPGEDGGRRYYVVRRMSDGSTLPAHFTEEEVGPD